MAVIHTLLLASDGKLCCLAILAFTILLAVTMVMILVACSDRIEVTSEWIEFI